MKKILLMVMVILLAACDKQEPQLYTLKNASGMEVGITNYGGRIVSLMVPDRDGELRDVVLGFDDLTDYYPKLAQNASLLTSPNNILGIEYMKALLSMKSSIEPVTI